MISPKQTILLVSTIFILAGVQVNLHIQIDLK